MNTVKAGRYRRSYLAHIVASLAHIVEAWRTSSRPRRTLSPFCARDCVLGAHAHVLGARFGAHCRLLDAHGRVLGAHRRVLRCCPRRTWSRPWHSWSLMVASLALPWPSWSHPCCSLGAYGRRPWRSCSRPRVLGARCYLFDAHRRVLGAHRRGVAAHMHSSSANMVASLALMIDADGRVLGASLAHMVP